MPAPVSDAPYLSVVLTSRNDDQDGGLSGRLQLSVEAWIDQARRYNLCSELLLVDSSGGSGRLETVLSGLPDTGPCQVRIIPAPAASEAVAGNAGIRQARGEFILVTRAGVLFSDELMQFLAARRLEHGRLYRIDRRDVSAGVPVPGTIADRLAYCRSHVVRLSAREGSFAVTPEGFRQNEPGDITRAGSDIYFGSGWFPVEIGDGEPFRWIENDAEVLARVPPEGAIIALEVEPGPGIAETPAVLMVHDRSGAKVAEWEVAGRIEIELAVPPDHGSDLQSFRLHVRGGGLPVLEDPRILNLRVFRCDRVKPGQPASPAVSGLSIMRENRLLLARLLTALRASAGFPALLRHGPGMLRAAVRLLQARGSDICAAGQEFRFGEGWYRCENAGGERFRWVSQDAQLLLRIRSENFHLALLVEPGPGLSYRPFSLIIRGPGGDNIARVPVHGLTYARVPVPLPPGTTATLRLTTEQTGSPVEADPRILNFRVLACCGDSGNAPAAYDCWSALTLASHPVGTDWAARLEESRPQIQKMGKPAFLHVNACRDFALMAREDWLDLRGWPELHLPQAYLDSLLCYAAHYAGIREEILREPLRIYCLDGGPPLPPEPTRLSSPAELLQLIAYMRSFRVPLIFNAGNWGLGETAAVTRDQARLPGAEPYISVVIAARNDNHGGNMLGRMQACFNSWRQQAERYRLPSEIIVVEWNPPAGCPRLRDSLQWSSSASCTVRFIEISPELHQRFPGAKAIPLHQMIAKNVGIRRARGEFVLATNLDIVFSAELMQFFAARPLQSRRLYRMDRHDVASEIPAGAAVDELLAFCRSHLRRIFTGEGGFEFDSGGWRCLEKQDIVAPDGGIRLGSGWYPVERYEAGHFRWIAREAVLLLQKPRAGWRLLLDADTGPSAGGGAVGVEIVTPQGSVLASANLRGRAALRLRIPDQLASGFRLRVLGGGIPLTRDLRFLNLRVFGIQWEQAPEPAGPEPGCILEVVPTRPPVNWENFVQAPSPLAACMRDPAYLHTNACGDFTLLSRDDWFSLRGYVELPIWPMHIDSLFCYTAHHAGIPEVILGDPMRVFHIEHLSGAGWTPEGESERRARISARKVTSMEYRDVEVWADRMRRFNAPVIWTQENWGLAGEFLRETEL